MCLKHFHKWCSAMLPQDFCTICKAFTQFVQEILQGFHTIAQVFFERFSTTCVPVFSKCLHNSRSSVFERFFTMFVHVFLKGVYNMCTCVSARLLQHAYKCFVQGFDTICT